MRAGDANEVVADAGHLQSVSKVGRGGRGFGLLLVSVELS